MSLSLFDALTKFFAPAGVDIDSLDTPTGGVRVCAWRGCSNLITTDGPGIDFCGHVCQRRWMCEANGITDVPDEHEAERQSWEQQIQ